ncbi:MAG: FAD-dependent oxidoreductase [Acidobacteria bacterium]|nr:FAD-dependent oxidoreductase [Acidobacteriota bacterium]
MIEGTSNKIVRDPVCHMEIEQERAMAERQHGGISFWFCSAGCAELFERDPDRYLSSPAPERAQFQLILIGGGPAGLTAALYASIQRLHTLLIADRIGGQAVESVDMQNYMGFQIIEGRELAARFRDQLLHSHFVEHRLDRATVLTTSAGCLHVRTGRGGHYACEAVILATGMKQRMLGVPGEERLLHRVVSFSVVQDAERFHGCDIAIIGGGNSGLQAAARLASVGRRLYLIAVGSLSGDADDIARARVMPNLTILEHTVVREVLGTDRVEGLRVMPAGGGEEREIPVGGVFVEIGFVPDSGIAAGLVETNKRGEIEINADCSTRTPGLFAAGDVSTAYGKRVAIACGEGAKAALAAYTYLSQRAKVYDAAAA